jgi:hypothetical protein
MVDVVDLAVAIFEFDEIADDLEDVLAAQRALLQRYVELQLWLSFSRPTLERS